MKSRQQKEKEYAQAKDLMSESTAILFVDFTDISNDQIEEFRGRVREQEGRFMVTKKRVLNTLFKDEGVDMDLMRFEGSVGAVFAKGNIEDATSPVYRFFDDLEPPKDVDKKFYLQKILGGYNLEDGAEIPREEVVYMGQLPPREVVLAQVLGAISAPITGFMHVMKEKANAGE